MRPLMREAIYIHSARWDIVCSPALRHLAATTCIKFFGSTSSNRRFRHRAALGVTYVPNWNRCCFLAWRNRRLIVRRALWKWPIGWRIARWLARGRNPTQRHGGRNIGSNLAAVRSSWNRSAKALQQRKPSARRTQFRRNESDTIVGRIPSKNWQF